MSSISLPSYLAPLLGRTSTYTTENHDHEQRPTLADRLGTGFSGAFVKHSRGGNIFLRLNAQENVTSLPVYGSGSLVEGTVELTKTEGVSSVEVKIEGDLLIREIAEGGNSAVKLCSDTVLLWTQDSISNVDCPPSMHFSIQLPTTFTHAGKTYPLPPTFQVKLSGIPGFTAAVNYSVSAVISKQGVPHVNSKALGLHIGSAIVSTPFVYYPRSRPSRGLPSPLVTSPNGFEANPEWKVVESILRSKKATRRPDIVMKLYTPASGIFGMTQPIPFYLTLESSAVSLAVFLPFSPSASTSASTSGYKTMRVQLMRQTTVDTKYARPLTLVQLPTLSKTDIWRVDSIGEGSFTLVANDETRISYSGKISIDPAVKIAGFKAAGLIVNDWILFTVTPLDPAKSSFKDIRQAIPVHLSTDPFGEEGVGVAPSRASISAVSISSTPLSLAQGTGLDFIP